jgi:hypothetical protein
LNAGNDPGSRRAAIAALRKVMARGEPWLSNLRKELAHLGDGEAWAKMVEGLLVGFPAGEKPAPEVRDRLIEWLKHPDPGVRELALENLMRITGRADALGYDPDKPTDAAVEEWRSLLTPRGR